MASVTSWVRLEPIPRTTDLEPALQAQVADPLWLLARQWQTLEFAGEDAGSPIVARVTADAARLDEVSFGASGPVDYDDLVAPLEAAVEAEPFSPADTERLRVDAGLHFLRLLARHGAPTAVRDRYLDRYAFTPGEEPVPLRAAGFRTLAGGRAPDGGRLHTDLAAHRGSGASLTDLPAAPDIPTAARTAVLAAANAWMAWYEGLLTAPTAAGAWDPSHMEYSFGVGAATGTGRVELKAAEYSEGHPDWHTFALHDRSEESEDSEPVVRRIVRTVIPTPASYAGMPMDRFWQFEDGRVSFGSIDAGPSDLTRLVLVEFALVFSNDWFVIPVDLEVGSVCTIEKLEIVDTFGVSTSVGPVPGGDGWSMFGITDPHGSGATPAFFVPPVLARTIESDPVESVTLLRDEMANMVWGVERRVLGPTGDIIDRDDTATPPGLGLQQVDGEVVDAELVYRLATPVPDHWIPFVPVPSADHDGVVLERRTLRRSTPGGPVDIPPLGRILEAGRPLRIEEEEVPREGAIVERTFQLARWTDGSTHLWLGRRKRVGRGEGRSGLRFDVLDRPTPSED